MEPHGLESCRGLSNLSLEWVPQWYLGSRRTIPARAESCVDLGDRLRADLTVQLQEPTVQLEAPEHVCRRHDVMMRRQRTPRAASTASTEDETAGWQCPAAAARGRDNAPAARDGRALIPGPRRQSRGMGPAKKRREIGARASCKECYRAAGPQTGREARALPVTHSRRPGAFWVRSREDGARS